MFCEITGAPHCISQKLCRFTSMWCDHTRWLTARFPYIFNFMASLSLHRFLFPSFLLVPWISGLLFCCDILVGAILLRPANSSYQISWMECFSQRVNYKTNAYFPERETRQSTLRLQRKQFKTFSFFLYDAY